jgi:hypothetical protein
VHPYAKALRAQLPTGEGSVPDLRVEPGLVTGNGAALSAPVIPPAVWAAVDVNRSTLVQDLEHTWEEPLIPKAITQVGKPEAVAALAAAFTEAVDADPKFLLRWRGYGPPVAADGDAWAGGGLPQLPPPARRPPDSVPKRFGTSGIAHAGEDIVDAFVRVYEAFGGA